MAPDEPSRDRRTDDGDASPPEGSRFDRWILPYLQDSMLWPVAVAGVAILVVFGAAVVLLAVRERNPFALAALLGLVFVSVDILYRQLRDHKLGAAGALLIGLWTLIVAAAVCAVALGLF